MYREPPPTLEREPEEIGEAARSIQSYDPYQA